MAFKILKYKWHKISIAVLGIIVALILILALFVNQYWSPILASKVKDVVIKSSDSLYRVDFSSIELHVLRGTIIFHDITLTPDTSVYNREKQQHLAPNNLVVLHVKRLTLSHIHPFKLYFQHKLDIGEIELREPILNISYQKNHTKDTVVKDRRTAWQKISKSLHSIHIGSILLGDVKFKYEDYSGHKLAISELKEMNLSAYNLLIDSVTQTDKSRLLYCKEIIAELNNYTAKTENGLYNYKINHMKLTTSKSRLNMEGMTLTPINAEAFFTKSHKDKFTLHLDSLQLYHFDFLSYHKYRIINASNLVFDRGTLEVFGNPNHLKAKTDRVDTYPNVGLYKIDAELKIDTVSIKHINIIYNEFNKKSGKTGSISFNNTSGRFLNITTNKTDLQKNNICAIKLSTYFMNEGKLNLDFAFNLTDADHSFSYKGSLGPMELKTINQATMPLTMVKITSGTLRQFDFDMHADHSKSSGKVELLYNDLKVNVLRSDTGLIKLKNKPLESLYANIFILKHNNPDVAGGIPRSFHVNTLRTSETPFFKFVWQSLLTGIKPAVGINKQTEDKTAALVNELSVAKQNRQIKKEKRIERRAERRKRRAEKKLDKQ